MVDFMTYPD